MYLKIGENIKKHRQGKELSQETLAERLDVSFQTVSKWERGACYPDIEMLPKIASFFGITVDALIGACNYREEEDVNAIQEELRKYDCVRDEQSLVKCAENGLKKYPNNYLLMAWIVYGAQNINPKRCIELGEYVLANCRDPHILNWVRSELCYAYLNNGNYESSIASAQKLPSASQSRDMILADILSGEEQSQHILQSIVAKYGYNFQSTMLKLLPHYEPLLQMELLKKSNKIYDAIYETDDYVGALKGKAENFTRLARICLSIGLNEDAVNYMNDALKCAEKHDSIPYGTKSSAILCGCDRYDYTIQLSGKLAHPYGKLKEQIVSSFEDDEFFKNSLNTKY